MILIIDDEPNLRISLKTYLEKKKFTVCITENCMQALKILETKLPEVIILDLILPEIDGFQFLTFLRENPKLYYIPVIILTAKSLTKDKIKAYSLGCNAYLSKPFSIEELISIINNLITHFNNYFPNFKSESVKEKITSHKIINDKSSIDSTSSLIELTPKEQKVLNLVALGYMNKEIAKQIQSSNRNVERYITRLLTHFQVNNRTELAKIAIENDYLTA
uniref:Conserved hypothetical plastid protein n=1 Tax=Bangiopsis subsimplex TaxID=139980 RepID=A0A1C9CCN3_9RHOD|nr:hypothetical protein Bangp_064 [Bangiopsis subsimplex]AOM66146.1 hypothetical protein Bangp_064 [Bangiopsis subsimplex]ARO90494.1 conserved hypothetical plastid protein [Bangiopsis subsimplex]